MDLGQATSYDVHVSTTITIRTADSLRDALVRRAEERGQSVSEVVREILEREFVETTIGARAGHLRGRLKLSRDDREAWRSRLRERNWRP